MNKLTHAFANGKALIPFLTAGDPDLETTAKLIRSMAAAGADLIEIGIPFSDPVAEGPVIQEASLRALNAGTTTNHVFDMVEEVRRDCSVALAMMTYANVVFRYGTERFLQRCQRAGIDAVILPDIPFEEKAEMQDAFRAADVRLISMVAPTSMERVSMIAGDAEGFLYCVSSLGVTGVRSRIDGGVDEMIRCAKSATDLPCAVGFGISTPEQAKQMAQNADGVIVGSAVVRLIGEHGRGSVPVVSDYIHSMKSALLA